MCVTAAVRGACATMVAALAWGEKTMSPIARQDSPEPPLASTVAGRFEECAAAAVRGRAAELELFRGALGAADPPVQRVVDPRSGRVSKMATHTRGVIDTFEILNEPDGRWAFTGTAADYATLLRAGHDAIAAGNPRAKVAIAATMSLRSRPWLAQVLGAAGPHPERLYDIANLHIRASLRALPTIMRAWRAFFAAHQAANKPLWVTEFGYPSDRAYQYDRVYRSGPTSQASYLSRALPALLDGGAAKVFVTLRDNLAGQFASEGIIAGAVSDPPQTAPLVVRKPAFTALRRLANTRSW
jgi:hypothetical protein